MKKLIGAALAAGALLAVAVPNAAHARFLDPTLTQTPSLVEDVACRMVRERVVRPNGTVVFRNVRRCTPGWSRPRCRMVRERVVRPNGSVVFRTVQRCR